MEIAIIAHDLKKELMTQFCIAYCGILSKHNLCETSITAKYTPMPGWSNRPNFLFMIPPPSKNGHSDP